MFQKKVVISGVNTYKLPVLSKKEMARLFQEFHAGRQEAREELVQGNLRLVLSVLQRFNNRGEYVDDLFQVGCIGLLKAVDNFDPLQEVHFSTYAVPMIIGEIKRYLRDNSSLRVSRSLKILIQKGQRIREKYIQENHREPRVDELAAELGVLPEDVAFIFNAGSDPISLYDTVFNDSTDPVYIIDVIADEHNDGNNWIDDLSLQEALGKLKERDRRILEGRFLEGKTQTEIAVELDISQAQVSRVEKSALLKIRDHLGREDGQGRQRKNA
jgi:RNA polymerase sporulation-specific sigma factor